MQRGTDLDEATRILRAGGLVAMPTETVYGLAADATSSQAVAGIYAAKGRPSGHPVIVHLADGTSLANYVTGPLAQANALAAAFWPGPLTLILPRGDALAAEVSGGSATVGIRVPAHPLAQQLLTMFGRPIAAPSANRFGAVSPTTADHVVADLGDAVDYVLDGGPCWVGVESTIVDLSSATPTLLRPGGVSREAIERVLGGPLAHATAASPKAPGLLASHYAPRALVELVAEPDAPVAWQAACARGERVALLASASAVARLAPPSTIIVATLPDDPAAAARALFATLRTLDDDGADRIIALIGDASWLAGIGEAIADRLARAAGPREPVKNT